MKTRPIKIKIIEQLEPEPLRECVRYINPPKQKQKPLTII